MSLKSHTAYFESNYYFSKLFYAGIRFGLNYNILVKESILEMETLTNNTYRTKFWGTVNSLQVGYNQPIGKHFNIRIQGQLGILSYKNNVGWPSKYNDPYVSKKVNVFRENLTLGINYRF
jgi:hypothetical protein